jgi:hypothetical protein
MPLELVGWLAVIAIQAIVGLACLGWARRRHGSKG